MKKILTMMVLMLGISMSACAFGGSDDEGDEDSKYATELLQVGETVPDINTLVDMNGDGVDPVANNSGRYVVLDFWASWCPDCRKEVPAMKALYEKYASDDIVFVGISFDTSKETLSTFCKDNDIKWEQFSEYKKWKETTVSNDFKIKWIPTIYLVDPDGKVALATVMTSKLEAELETLVTR